jgi:hypothetical protein
MKAVSNIEELLGPKYGRYCSAGFKNIDFSFSDFFFFLKVLKTNLEIDFSKNYHYSNWSSKKGPSPHLRSTEYVVVSVLMCELYLSLTLKISQSDLAKSWVKYIKLKALPYHEADEIHPVNVSLKKSMKLSSIQTESSFEIKVGQMMLQITVVHPNAVEKNITESAFPESYIDFAYYMQNLDFNFYKTGYKNLDHIIYDVKTEPDLMATTAHVRQITSFDRHLGIGTHYVKTMDLASFILVSGQLIEVLLQAIEHINNEDSGNFWVRGLEIYYPSPTSIDQMTESVQCKSVKMLQYNDHLWRVAKLQTTLGNIQAEFNVAYHLS